MTGHLDQLGQEVRSARLARGWSRESLAEKCGTSVEQIDAIEEGLADPGPALKALQLEVVTMVLTPLPAQFLRHAQPLLDRISEDRLPLVLAEVLAVLGRAAAGIDTPADDRREYQQFNIVIGDHTTINQKNA